MKYSLKSLVYGLFLTWFTLSPVWADDTEIYFAGTANLIVRPNILFILDTSGSMGNHPKYPPGHPYAGYYNTSEPRKIESLKSAMTSIISNVQDVNVGLMRFSIPGGPILYPVTYIDEEVNEFQAFSGISQSRISSGDDDAEERIDGSVRLDSDTLISIETNSLEEEGNIIAVIDSNSDDAYEGTNRDRDEIVETGSSTLYLNTNRDGRNYHVLTGLRFASVDVPKDADIVSATIDFTVSSRISGDNEPRIDIRGERSSNPATFQEVDRNLSSRTTTSAKVDWNPGSYNPSAGETLTAPATSNSPPSTDLSSIVSEITSLSGWESGNPMVFLFQRDNTNRWNRRLVSSREGGDPARLNVTYTSNTGSAENSFVALRFNDVWVPQGADITSASVKLTAADDSSEQLGGFLVFRAEQSDDSSALNNTINDISGRLDLDSVTVTTSVPDLDSGDEFVSPDLSDVIEEVTRRPGWCGGNSLTVLISGEDAEALFSSYERDDGSAPVLDIEYDVNSVDETACFVQEREVVISDGDDDVEQNGSSVSYSHTQLQLGGSDYTGLRFNDVRLIEDADVSEAYLEFSVIDNDVSLPAALTIQIENTSDAAAFQSSTRPSTRSYVPSSVSWTIDSGWTSVGQVYRSPDISSLLESVVGLSGWDPGNSVMFSITGSGQVEAASLDGSNLAPTLVIKASQDQFNIISNTAREELLTAVDSLTASGNTPVVDTYYEGAIYYKGLDVDYGLTRGYSSSNPDNRDTRVSHPSSYTGGAVVRASGCTDENLNSTSCRTEYISTSPSTPSYISPITEACQKSYIVLLTDGYANENESRTKIGNMISPATCEDIDNDEECGHELAYYMSNTDQSGLSGTQVVRTHTVGFDINDTWLQGISSISDGTHYQVANANDLTTAFDQIIKAIKAANTTFTQPGFTVNDLNRLSHREDIYFSLFKPVETEKWLGNLKKYRLDGANSILVDANDDPAIDVDTGFFATDRQSFWSSEADGNDVGKGGAADNLPAPASRNIYTYVGNYPSPITSDGLDVLSHNSNSVVETNSLVTKALLGIESQTTSYRTNLIRWARGEDTSRGNRQELGDPLHSIPVLMTYEYDSIDETFDSTVFIGTNEGYIHAVDADTGTEIFSFIPQELLPNLDAFYTNAETGSSRTYGMDGDLTLVYNDENSDGDYLDAGSGDYVWLYAGMRRGGRNYYSLDVTSRTSPKLKWVIKGGAGGTAGFSELGYSWSKLKEITINYNGTTKNLLLFGGGYDPSQDTRVTRTADAMGRAIYMIDADTGALFWKAGGDNTYDLELADMDYSIPSDITVLDMDNDGYTDQFYVGDMGGQVWRFDIANGEDSLEDLVTGGVIADLSTSGSGANNRRFYYAPDLSVSVDGSNKVLALGIGSGWRAHPLDEVVEDRYYLIKQFSHIFSAPTSYTKLTESDLYDATENLIAEGDADEKDEAELAMSNGSDRTKEGWYIRLTNPGEKVLAASLTVNGQIVFTTYEPEPPDVVSCQAVQGTARAYLVKILTAEPLEDISGDGNLNKGDRVISLDQGAIPATPKILDPETGAPVILIGPEILDEADTGKQIFKTYWRENTEE